MIKVGIVGIGRMGRQHLAILSSMDVVNVASICDPKIEDERYEGILSSSLDEMLKRSDIDAIIVASPTHTHEIIVGSALNSGKHVFCEKPLTLDPEVDLRLERLASSKSLVLQVGFWRRFAEPYSLLKSKIGAGAIGKVVGFRLSQWDACPPPLEFCVPEHSGGIEIDCGIHETDLLLWLTNDNVKSVSMLAAPSSSQFASIDDRETVFGIVRLNSGIIASIDLTRTAGGTDLIRTEVFGQQGSISVSIDRQSELIVRDDSGVRRTSFTGDVIEEALRQQILNFHLAVREPRMPSQKPSGAHSSNALKVASALQHSQRSNGAWIDLTGKLSAESEV